MSEGKKLEQKDDEKTFEGATVLRPLRPLSIVPLSF